MIYDYLIVGAGFAGSVIAERIASQLNKKILVIEKREHIGGNCFDFFDEYGICIHKYGPHAFHTNSQKIWDYLSKFTLWTPYEHKVLAEIEKKKVPIPFNFNSIEMLFPKTYAEKIISLLKNRFGENIKIPILKLKNEDNKDLKFLAEFIYENVFLGYTQKQWGFKPEELDYSVTSRVPIFIGRDNRYFYDKYQAIPKNGYTKLFEKILKHKNIEILLNTEFKHVKNDLKYKKLIFTGPIDNFFDYIFGELPYRSLSFNFQNLNQEYFQEVAQVNYPNNYKWTRITEFKHFLSQKQMTTTIAYEFPQVYSKNINEPYYPIPRKENEELYKKYLDEAKKIENSVIFLGRLAEYKYYNMDEIVGNALLKFENLFVKKRL